MKEHSKNILILILCCLLTGAVCYAIGVVTSIQWIVNLAVERFDLKFGNLSINYNQLGVDIWRLKGALTNGNY